MRHTIALAFIMLVSFSSLFAQKEKERVSKHTTVKGDNISITYGQPSKKGRIIFGELVPYGKVWRTGADEATEVTLAKDCMFGGKKLKAGTYTMFTIPGGNEWTVILNSELKQWGAYGYDKVKDKDVLKTAVPVKMSDKEVETFTITVEKNGFQMSWDKVMVFVPVQF